MPLSRIAIIASICFGLTAAVAQQREVTTAATSCTSSTRGSIACPNYTAPAATAVPGASMDGSTNVAASTSTTLFKGAVPPNAFMVRAYWSGLCVVNDNGLAAANSNPEQVKAGFSLILDAGTQLMGPISVSFTTPPGYKPIGPVSIWCDGPTYVAARGW